MFQGMLGESTQTAFQQFTTADVLTAGKSDCADRARTIVDGVRRSSQRQRSTFMAWGLSRFEPPVRAGARLSMMHAGTWHMGAFRVPKEPANVEPH